MLNSNLASLPPSMLHKILSKVATSHLRDFGCARIAFSGFNQIGREEYFYRSADLFNLNDWIDEANALRAFRLRCYNAGNLEAIYIRGHWGYEKPEVFMSLLERINPNVSHDCWCSAVIEPVFVVSLDGSRTRWTCNHCFWQCAAWDFCNDIHLTAGHWPIEN
uniref:F-box domain-containing protein n=1 Tax=Brassica campestris TaxID=3711 RepID=M4DDY2_BRACM